MRTIDADRLLEEKRIHTYYHLPNGDIAIPLIDIKNAPTIEPEHKRGHWIRHPEQRNIFNGKTIECSECHEKYTVQYVEDELFCRHCGADMREPEDIPMEYFESGGR